MNREDSMNDAPKLLVEWSSPWKEVVSAIRPALGRSSARLAGEARTDLFPYPGILLAWLLEAGLVLAAIVLPGKLATMRTFTPPPLAKYEVIYFSGEELTRTEDAGGAQSGRSGRGGGQEAYHRTQTIRVARGNSIVEKVVDAPKLNLPRSDSPVANLLAIKPIPRPAPAEGLKSSLPTSALPQVAVVPPTPEISRDNVLTTPALNAGVIPPAPTDAQRELAALRVPVVRSADVVPPPVSAPERDSNLNAKLLLPAPSVIAPPPTHVTRELGSVGGAEITDLQNQVVPPPVQTGARSVDKQAVGGLLGSTNVIPPPVQGVGRSLDKQAVGGLLGSANVIPPPPTIGGGTSVSGRGPGSKGNGAGGPMDLGSVVAPPSAGGGSGGGTGIVLSSKPGSKVGVPGSGGTGSLAMSPGGGAHPGLGGSGGGSGIGRGNGPGGGFSGGGPGAGKEGSGRGSDSTAHGGISPYPGPGGAGTGTSGTPAIPGVSVKGGGSNVVTLPSFSANGSQPTDPSRSSTADHRGPDITIVASSRSGGAFNFYGSLKGDKVYTIYIETVLGTSVMQYADPTSAEHPYAEDLTAPQPVHTDLPAGLPHSRLVITCILTPSGLLRDLRVLEPGPAVMTSKVLAALSNWKFRPAWRGDQPVEVNAILGFNIDTRDRF